MKDEPPFCNCRLGEVRVCNKHRIIFANDNFIRRKKQRRIKMNVRQAVELLQEKGYTVSGGQLSKIKITRKVIGEIKAMLEKTRQVVVVRKKSNITVFSLDGYKNRSIGVKKANALRRAASKTTSETAVTS